MAIAFVTFLGTENFLPGVIALNNSLKKHHNYQPVLTLVTRDISRQCIRKLKEQGIIVKQVNDIINPYELGDDHRSYKCTFSKLSIFDLTEYEKLVYIDADMLVCNNIEELFDKQHMSAVIAGKLYPANASWQEMNTGLIVLEPNKDLFHHMVSLIGKLPSTDGSDQGFLHSFFSEWPQSQVLHLDHKYNVPFTYLNEYCGLNSFVFEYVDQKLTTNISLIHYWDIFKPWNFRLNSPHIDQADRKSQSISLWWDYYQL